ncbi:hypothetical protein [Streptomyces microflavus]|uniref:hypothetical protein n=1 Tax=Streptomyces microflavus TaxID=1919 RepID=UPI0036EA5021
MGRASRHRLLDTATAEFATSPGTDSHLVHPELVHDRCRTALVRAVRRAFAPRNGTACAP